MLASVISTDVGVYGTETASEGVRLLYLVREGNAEGPFNKVRVHAGCFLDAVGGKVILAFAAGLDGDAVECGFLGHVFCQVVDFVEGRSSHHTGFHEWGNLAVFIQEGDGAALSVPVKLGAKICKHLLMPVYAVFVGDEDGVIAPHSLLGANDCADVAEVLQDNMFCGHVRFNIFLVSGNRPLDVPGTLDSAHVLQEVVGGVFRPENDAVHIFWSEADTRDAELSSDLYVTFVQIGEEILAAEGGDVVLVRSGNNAFHKA